MVPSKEGEVRSRFRSAYDGSCEHEKVVYGSEGHTKTVHVSDLLGGGEEGTKAIARRDQSSATRNG